MKKIHYIVLLAGVLLAGCKGTQDVDKPAEAGQQIILHFSMESNMIDEPVDTATPAPMRIPGDPGKDDFLVPTNLYFILWVQTTGGTKMMTAVKETGLTASDWVPDGRGIYTLKDKSYTLTIPKDRENVQQLQDGVFHVFAFASTQDLSSVGGISYTAFTPAEVENGRTITGTTTTLAELEALTYAVPGGVSTQEEKRTFFRSMYSTALSETSHNQMATSPTIRLRHTASRLDINWECPTATTGLPKDQTSPLTANSTWTIATAYYPTAFSLFKPGANTGATTWNETITIDEGMRYNGRYVTYLPMPTTPTFTVTSNSDNLDGDSQSKTMELTAGSDVNYATWMRALWTIK